MQMSIHNVELVFSLNAFFLMNLILDSISIKATNSQIDPFPGWNLVLETCINSWLTEVKKLAVEFYDLDHSKVIAKAVQDVNM